MISRSPERWEKRINLEREAINRFLGNPIFAMGETEMGLIPGITPGFDPKTGEFLHTQYTDYLRGLGTAHGANYWLEGMRRPGDHFIEFVAEMAAKDGEGRHSVRELLDIFKSRYTKTENEKELTNIPATLPTTHSKSGEYTNSPYNQHLLALEHAWAAEEAYSGPHDPGRHFIDFVKETVTRDGEGKHTLKDLFDAFRRRYDSEKDQELAKIPATVPVSDPKTGQFAANTYNNYLLFLGRSTVPRYAFSETRDPGEHFLEFVKDMVTKDGAGKHTLKDLFDIFQRRYASVKVATSRGTASDGAMTAYGKALRRYLQRQAQEAQLGDTPAPELAGVESALEDPRGLVDLAHMVEAYQQNAEERLTAFEMDQKLEQELRLEPHERDYLHAMDVAEGQRETTAKQRRNRWLRNRLKFPAKPPVVVAEKTKVEEATPKVEEATPAEPQAEPTDAAQATEPAVATTEPTDAAQATEPTVITETTDAAQATEPAAVTPKPKPKSTKPPRDMSAMFKHLSSEEDMKVITRVVKAHKFYRAQGLSEAQAEAKIKQEIKLTQLQRDWLDATDADSGKRDTVSKARRLGWAQGKVTIPRDLKAPKAKLSDDTAKNPVDLSSLKAFFSAKSMPDLVRFIDIYNFHSERGTSRKDMEARTLELQKRMAMEMALDQEGRDFLDALDVAADKRKETSKARRVGWLNGTIKIPSSETVAEVKEADKTAPSVEKEEEPEIVPTASLEWDRIQGIFASPRAVGQLADLVKAYREYKTLGIDDKTLADKMDQELRMDQHGRDFLNAMDKPVAQRATTAKQRRTGWVQGTVHLPIRREAKPSTPSIPEIVADDLQPIFNVMMREATPQDWAAVNPWLQNPELKPGMKELLDAFHFYQGMGFTGEALKARVMAELKMNDRARRYLNAKDIPLATGEYNSKEVVGAKRTETARKRRLAFLKGTGLMPSPSPFKSEAQIETAARSLLNPITLRQYFAKAQVEAAVQPVTGSLQPSGVGTPASTTTPTKRGIPTAQDLNNALLDGAEASDRIVMETYLTSPQNADAVNNLWERFAFYRHSLGLGDAALRFALANEMTMDQETKNFLDAKGVGKAGSVKRAAVSRSRRVKWLQSEGI